MYSILCADDDPEIRDIYERLLKRRGYQVRCVGNGVQVLAELKENDYDLILMDAKMPIMGGVDATERIRQNPDVFHIPIIFVSGYTEEQEILRCLSMGGTDFVCKPFEIHELMAKIQFILRKRDEMMECSLGGLPVGTRVARRYEVLAKIDAGGFSNIYKARDVTLKEDNIYALKIFNFPFTKESNRQQLYTILREAYQLCKLDHPCIVKIADFGQFGCVIYIVLEYIDGQSLDILVEKNGPLNEANSAFIGFEIASTLEYMDSRDMTHRDVKPDNIMVTKHGDVKLVDFGLAKQQGEQTLSIKADEFQGTAQYVSPEQINGGEVDIMSDIYSLGTSLYFMSTGRSPFAGKDFAHILKQQLELLPAPPKSLCSSLSGEFSDLVMAMIAKDPLGRPSPADVRHRFGEILAVSHHD